MLNRLYRPHDALLAGVCAELARRLGWNVWALRAVAVFGLVVATVPTAIAYTVLALVMGLVLIGKQDGSGVEAGAPGAGPGRDPRGDPGCDQAGPGTGARAARIAELERQFRELERRNQQQR